MGRTRLSAFSQTRYSESAMVGCSDGNGPRLPHAPGARVVSQKPAGHGGRDRRGAGASACRRGLPGPPQLGGDLVGADAPRSSQWLATRDRDRARPARCPAVGPVARWSRLGLRLSARRLDPRPRQPHCGAGGAVEARSAAGSGADVAPGNLLAAPAGQLRMVCSDGQPRAITSRPAGKTGPCPPSRDQGQLRCFWATVQIWIASAPCRI